MKFRQTTLFVRYAGENIAVRSCRVDVSDGGVFLADPTRKATTTWRRIGTLPEDVVTAMADESPASPSEGKAA